MNANEFNKPKLPAEPPNKRPFGKTIRCEKCGALLIPLLADFNRAMLIEETGEQLKRALTWYHPELDALQVTCAGCGWFYFSEPLMPNMK